MRITTTDRAFDLALRRDSVVLSLSAHTVGKVHKAFDSAATDTAKKTMVGAYLTRTLLAEAEKLTSKSTGFLVRDIENVTYQDGRLDFQLKPGTKPFIPFASIKQEGRPVMESFSPADAERFVQAVRSAKRAG
jgi:hypothetical protein